MYPFAEADGHCAPWLGLVGGVVPDVAAVIDGVVLRAEHPVGQRVVARELPALRLHMMLGAFRRQRQQGNSSGTAMSPEKCKPA